MEKKIIAIALVLVLMVTVFVGCTKKLETTKINGIDVVLATDEEGNTIIDDNFRIAFYVTDANEELVTGEDGEPQTNWMQIYDTLAGEDVLMAENYKFNIPEGWSANGWKMVKDGTDNKCYIQCVKVSEIKDDINLPNYLTVLEEQNSQIIEALEKEGYRAQIVKDEATITLKNLPCLTYSYTVLDNNGDVVHYSENFYYVQDECIYVIEYTCLDGIGYDENFDFGVYLNTNFVSK